MKRKLADYFIPCVYGKTTSCRQWSGQAMVLGNFQCWCVLLIGIMLEQGPSTLAIGGVV